MQREVSVHRWFAIRAARYATVCFKQNRYSRFVLTAAFLVLPVAVFVLTGRLSENFLCILLPPLYSIPNKQKNFCSLTENKPNIMRKKSKLRAGSNPHPTTGSPAYYPLHHVAVAVARTFVTWNFRHTVHYGAPFGKKPFVL